MAAIEPAAQAPDVIQRPMIAANGEQVTIGEALAQGPVVVGIYKSSCQASKTMFPFLERLHRRHAGTDLTVLGVSQDSANITKSFARRLGITFPILIEGEEYPISRGFGLASTPTVYVLRPDGTIAYETMGFFKVPVNGLGDAVAELVGADKEPLYGEADSDVPAFVPG